MTKKKPFTIFKEECLRLQKEWGLTNWKLWIEEKDLGKTIAARVNPNLNQYSASIEFNSYSDDDRISPKEHAKHEMIHLMLGRFSELAYCRFLSEPDLSSAEEELVRRLEKLL